MFRSIERSDGSFMRLCLVYLMLIAFLPVPSGTLGRYGSEFPAVVFFAITLMLVGIMELLIWRYATDKHRLVRPEVTDLEIAEVQWRTLSVVIMFGVSILIAFISLLWAMLSWLSLFVTNGLISRHFHRSSDNHPA